MSSATTLKPPNHLNPHYQEYQQYHRSNSGYKNGALPINHSSNGPYSSFSSNGSPSQSFHPVTEQRSAHQADSVSDHQGYQKDMAASKGSKKADWHDFYRNGIPKEVIVIDDTPERTPRRASPDQASTRPTQHLDKRRKTDANQSYPVRGDYGYSREQERSSARQDHSGSSSARTTSALYSTAPTSLTSQTSAPNQAAASRYDDAKTGQKRKRPARTEDDDSPAVELLAAKNAWSNYVPPPKPPIKCGDVYVTVVRDKISQSTHKIDDEDGHYIVNVETDLTDRYRIDRLLGQGTFGKVVEAFDRKKKTKCAIKIIRAVPKYRDASRIELRVLHTLQQNDRHNRNKCIHLRDCFDFRNHICIVMDLLGSSVFDFLKANSFTPFPSTHIQSFARQLFTSVAFLHDLNLIHTDLKPENILLVSNLYQTFTYNRQVPSSSRSSTRSAKFRKVLLDPEIRLIDFGSATFDDEYHSSVVSTRHYRAPEIILNLGWSFPCDIWSIGCILVEFFTGDALFQTHDNLEHLAMMEAVCGSKIDKEMIVQVRNGKGNSKNSAAQFFLPRAYRLDYPNTETPRTSKKYVKSMKRLDETIPLTGVFNQLFWDLLRRIFVYDPKKRITAKEALKHPWFNESLKDDGTEAFAIRQKKEAAERLQTERLASANNGYR